MNIFIAKLNFSTSSEALQELFEQFGGVASAKVIMDRETGRSKGFGFVEMPNDDEGVEAISGLDGSDFDGNTIAVKQAEPRESRGGGFNGSGNRSSHSGFGSGGNPGR